MLQTFFRETYAAIPATVDRDRIVGAIEAYLASYEAGDVAGRALLFAPDVVAEEPVGTPPMHGLDRLKAFWQGSLDAGWRCTNTPKRIVVNGNEACVLFQSELTVEGQGAVSLEVYETLVFDNEGRILSLRAYNDEGCLS